ncbi:ABC transporter permease [Pararobbsia silviterrae]|uniref:ABC transporter permease n=2 Tax=Pararobbsia silviterrae TaxID=1792498 RepID=A0A494XVR8_9BURK|nr:ABC transporter permease [Pararobbsia silviterrae]
MPSRSTPDRAARTRRPVSFPYGLIGGIAVVLIWWLATHVGGQDSLARAFSPDAALAALVPLVRDDHLVEHAIVSLGRVAIGLGWAMALGVPIGLVIGRFRTIDRMLTPAFQFLRMISPLSWMPIAVMSLGVGNRSVCFLLAFAAVWPIIMNTAAGIAHLDARWIQLGRSLAASRAEMLLHVYLPGIAAHLLTGLRLAVGILWIVLVPAEMLGVSAGLGYLILDTRDRLAYSELSATILVIGAIGFAIDTGLRALYRRFVR